MTVDGQGLCHLEPTPGGKYGTYLHTGNVPLTWPNHRFKRKVLDIMQELMNASV